MRKATLIGCMMLLFILALTGCFRILSETTVLVELRELGSMAGTEFPGATIELMANGSAIKSLELGRGHATCEFRCAPGEYTVNAQSYGRSTSLPVETNDGSTSALLNFNSIILYGEVLLDSARLPSSFGAVKIELLKDNRIIGTQQLSERYNFQFEVEPGQYQINVTAGTQKVTLNAQAQKSRFCLIDLSRTCHITGSVLEVGNPPGADWPGGTLRVETPDGLIVQEIEIRPEQERFDFAAKPGIYRVVAQSGPREPVSAMIDLSTEQIASFQLNFEEVVLHGNLVAGFTSTPASTLAVLKNRILIRQIDLSPGSTTYSLPLEPGEYELAMNVPENGSLSRYNVSIARSKRYNIDLHKTVSIRGQITENGLLPIPDQFPLGGQVLLKTKDGVVRKKVVLSPDGTFETTIFAGEYLIEAVSEGRTASIVSDATRVDQQALLDYKEIVLQGSLNWRDGGVPASFPETKVELKHDSSIVKSVVVPRGSSTFKAVLAPGNYSVTLTLKDTGITVSKVYDSSLSRSSIRTLDISNDIFLLSGKVTAGGGTPNDAVLLNVADQHGITQKIEAMGDGSYEAYVKKETYSIQLSCPSYLPATYSVYVGGDTRRDLSFTHCNIACALTLKSLLSTDCHISAALNDYFGRDTPLTDVLFTGVTYLPLFVQRVYTFNVVAPIGEKVYFQVFGVDVGALIKWTLTAEQNCSEVRTIPVVLGG